MTPVTVRTTAPGALVRITNVVVERVSWANEGFSVELDPSPVVGPISPPPGRIVLAPSPRRAAGIPRRQLLDAANTSLNTRTNPTAESSSRTPAAAIQTPQPRVSRA